MILTTSCWHSRIANLAGVPDKPVAEFEFIDSGGMACLTQPEKAKYYIWRKGVNNYIDSIEAIR